MYRKITGRDGAAANQMTTTIEQSPSGAVSGGLRSVLCRNKT